MSKQTIKVGSVNIEADRISLMTMFKSTGEAIYFRVTNEEDNPDDYNVIPGNEDYDAIKEFFIQRRMRLYNDVGEMSTGFCQRQRIGIENDLKTLGYKVQKSCDCKICMDPAHEWIAVKA